MTLSAPAQGTRPESKTLADARRTARRTARPHARTVALISALTAVALTALFIVWSDRYLAVVYNAAETSTRARFASGFIATGVLEATALVLAATIALIAGLITVTGDWLYQQGVGAKLLVVAAAVLVAAAVPAGILSPVLAIAPLFFAVIAVAITAHRRRPI